MIEPTHNLVPVRWELEGNVTVHAAAVGMVAGKGHLIDTNATGVRRPLARIGDPSTAAWNQPCEILRLDASMPIPPAAWIAKNDTEGTEADVVGSLGARLNDHHAILLVEIEASHNPEFRAALKCWKGTDLPPTGSPWRSAAARRRKMYFGTHADRAGG